MRRIPAFVAICATFAGPVLAGDLAAVADANIDSASGKTAINFGGNGVVAVSRERTAFIRFDAAELARTPGALATLNLSVFQAKNSKNAVEVRLITGPWNERTLTAANAPRISSTALDSKTVSALDVGRTLSFDVTGALAVWRRDPNRNFGLAIVASSPLPNLQFLSRELRAGATLTLRDDPVLAIIDIRPILARHNVATNAAGLAFNPDANVIYLGQGTDPSVGVIYTLDTSGELLNELDLQRTYRPGAWISSMSYDRGRGHLFAVIVVSNLSDPTLDDSHLVELDPRTGHVFSEVPFPAGFPEDLGGGGGVLVREDGIWQARFGEDRIRHYTRQRRFIEDVSVAASFPGFAGPDPLTSSFSRGGFFFSDWVNERIVEVDISGHEVATASTVSLGDGRGLAIDSDVGTKRIFLQVNNQEIYILASQFIGRSP